MGNPLKISLGQYSDKGRKEINQDFHGACIPSEPQLSAKGVAIAIADGISSSDVSQVASQTAVASFLDDYYCTSDAWSVKTSAERVLNATNSWLHAQTQQSQHRYDKNKGYVCTLSALVIKSTTAHLFHVGDTRIYRLHRNALEQLTNDHRTWVSAEQSYLARALGVSPQLEIDYLALPIERGDIFILSSDGVHEYMDASVIHAALRQAGDALDEAARFVADEAYNRGSRDNLTLQIVRIDALPDPLANEMVQQLGDLALPPPLTPRMTLDGYRIVRELHISARSHIFLAVDEATGQRVALKTPSIDLRADAAYIERFLMEEWVARRLNNAHVLKAWEHSRERKYVYVVSEYIEGQTLEQWMRDNPRPDLEVVRGIVEQIARGLQAFHRLEMLHQDLRPANVMIDVTGTVKIIDFGATRVAGILESTPQDPGAILGTAQYTAPEYFLGQGGTARSDLFSLGVITYQMLTGKLPYGAQVAKARTRAAQSRLRYESVLDDKREIPAWFDDVLRKAVHPDPLKRYAELSEFVFDLRHPNAEFLQRTRQPLLERNPLLFWKSLCFLLTLALMMALAMRR